MATYLRYYIEKCGKDHFVVNSIGVIDGVPMETPSGFVEWIDSDEWEYVAPSNIAELMKTMSEPVNAGLFAGHLRRRRFKVDLMATVTSLGPYAAYREGTDKLVAYCDRAGNVVYGVDGVHPVGHPAAYEVVSINEKAWE